MTEIVQNNHSVQRASLPSLGDAPRSEKKFSADDAMNAALNFQIDMLLDLSTLTISMGSMQATILKEAGKNAQSRVEMYRKLLDAQTICQNAHGFAVITNWANSPARIIAAQNDTLPETFRDFCIQSGMGSMYLDVYNDPNITREDKILFANEVGTWLAKSGGSLESFMGLSSTISYNLQDAANRAQDWQSLADAMKPTQIQQAITTLIAEIGQSTSMWEKVIAM